MRTLTFSITPRHLAYWTAGIITGVFMGATIQHLIAWTGPSATPPSNNAEAPINVSAITQVKNGDLGLAGNLSAGMVQLNTVHTEGTACPLNGLLARDASGATLSCVSLVWVKGGGDNLGNQIANATSGLNMSNTTIFNLSNPVSAQDAATKAYVDGLVGSSSGDRVTHTELISMFEGAEASCITAVPIARQDGAYRSVTYFRITGGYLEAKVGWPYAEWGRVINGGGAGAVNFAVGLSGENLNHRYYDNGVTTFGAEVVLMSTGIFFNSIPSHFCYWVN